jgi:glutamine amidotransferase
MNILLDYGVGNLASIFNIIKRLGGRVAISRDRSELNNAKKIIIAGVGAFDHGMTNLRQGGWIDALNEAVLVRKIPVLGICLGMQLMCRSSEEGILPGLQWINAHVKRFKLPPDSNLKIPHMGWNTVNVVKPNPLIATDEGEQRFYFVHSYHAICINHQDILATVYHGYEVTAAFSHENIFGVQFHPEKSHRFGMALMKKFLEL